MNTRKWYSTARVAHLLRVDPTTIWRMIRRGHLDGVQLAPGSPFRIPRSAVTPLVAKMRTLHHVQ